MPQPFFVISRVRLDEPPSSDEKPSTHRLSHAGCAAVRIPKVLDEQKGTPGGRFLSIKTGASSVVRNMPQNRLREMALSQANSKSPVHF